MGFEVIKISVVLGVTYFLYPEFKKIIPVTWKSNFGAAQGRPLRVIIGAQGHPAQTLRTCADPAQTLRKTLRTPCAPAQSLRTPCADPVRALCGPCSFALSNHIINVQLDSLYFLFHRGFMFTHVPHIPLREWLFDAHAATSGKGFSRVGTMDTVSVET